MLLSSVPSVACLNPLEEPIPETVKPAQPAPKNKRKNAAGASESVPVPMKRPSAAARTVSEDKKEMCAVLKNSGVAAPAAAHEKNDEDDQDEVDETPGVMKRPSALQKPSFTGRGDAKKKAHTKDHQKKAGKPSDVTYHNPSWHKAGNNWQLKSSHGYIMSVACPQIIRFPCHLVCSACKILACPPHFSFFQCQHVPTIRLAVLWLRRRIPRKWLCLGCLGQECLDTLATWLKIAAVHSAQDTLLQKLKQG